MRFLARKQNAAYQVKVIFMILPWRISFISDIIQKNYVTLHTYNYHVILKSIL